MSNQTLQSQLAELCDTFELESLATVKVGEPSHNSVTADNSSLTWTVRDENNEETTQHFDNLDDFVFSICATDLRKKVYQKTRDSLVKNKEFKPLMMSCSYNDLFWMLENRPKSEVAFREERNVRIEKRNISKFIKKHNMNHALGLKNPKLIYANTGQKLQKIGVVLNYVPLIAGWLILQFTDMPISVAMTIFGLGFLTAWWSVILEGGDLFDRWKLGYLKWQKNYYSAFAVLALAIAYAVLMALGIYPDIAKILLYVTVAVALFHIVYF